MMLQHSRLYLVDVPRRRGEGGDNLEGRATLRLELNCLAAGSAEGAVPGLVPVGRRPASMQKSDAFRGSQLVLNQIRPPPAGRPSVGAKWGGVAAVYLLDDHCIA